MLCNPPKTESDLFHHDAPMMKKYYAL